MRNSTNSRGRTFWDLIAEHPKMVFSLIILLIVVVVFLSLNKYSIKSSVLSLEPDKQQVYPINQNNDSVKNDKVAFLDTTAYIQRKAVPNLKTKSHKEQIVIKEPNKDTVKTQVVNVTSNNQNGGITANQVNIGSIPRNLDMNTQRQLQLFLSVKDEKIDINSVMGDAESFQFANQINDYLKSQGFTKVDGVSQSVFTKPVIGQFMKRDNSGVKILIGSNPK